MGPLDARRGPQSWSARRRLVFVGRALRGRLQADCPTSPIGTVEQLEAPGYGHIAAYDQ